MKPIGVLLLLGGFIAAIIGARAWTEPATANADPASGTSGQTEATLAPGAAILVELNSGIDSKKVKAGDSVVAHTTGAMKSTDDRTIMPRGTKIEGHITRASARSKGVEESALGIQFDKAILKDGGEIRLNVIIQALGAPVNFSGPIDPGPTPSPSNTGTTQTSPMSGNRTPPPNVQPAANGDASASNQISSPSSPQLDARSRGAVGMHGITLNAEQANNRPATVVVSNGKSVHLDGGTQMLLVVQAQGTEPAGP
jgi:hypothetical protein